MKFALGFFAGLGAAWAALAIWQRVPPLGPIDPRDDIDPALVPDVEPWPPPAVIDEKAFYRAADANQLVYRSQHRAGLGAVRRAEDRWHMTEGNVI